MSGEEFVIGCQGCQGKVHANLRQANECLTRAIADERQQFIDKAAIEYLKWDADPRKCLEAAEKMWNVREHMRVAA